MSTKKKVIKTSFPTTLFVKKENFISKEAGCYFSAEDNLSDLNANNGEPVATYVLESIKILKKEEVLI